MLAALFFLQALSPRPAVPAQPIVTQTPAQAMDYLVRTLPRVQLFDAWEGGWGEAPLDRAKFSDMCELTTGAPFVRLFYDSGEQHDAPARQSWRIDLTAISGVGQNGKRAGYKLSSNPNMILGFTAPDVETARGIATALETMRKACSDETIPSS
jgi:hypothetical protein